MGLLGQKAVRTGLYGIGMGMILYACGEIGGSGQCGGVETNGVCIAIETIQPFYLDEEVGSVDVVQFADCDGDATTDDPEPMASHSANVSFSSLSLLPEETASVPPFVTLTAYSIDYTADPGPTVGVAINQRQYSQTMKIETGTDETFNVVLLDLDSKTQYLNSGGDPFDYPSYTASYTFAGTDSYGKSVSVQGRAQFEIGSFDNCSSN